MSQEELKRRVGLFAQFAEQDEGNDKSDPNAVEERLTAFFDSRGLESPRYLLDVEQELREAQANLARSRGAPVAVRICVDPESLEPDSSGGWNFRPDLSGSREVFVQSDFGQPLLVLEGSLWNGEEHIDDLGLVAISFTSATPMPLWGVTLAKFGYPNEEAFGDWMVPGFCGVGFYEILNSVWSEEIVKANRERFPETPDDLGLRHFMVACKENTLEVLANGFTMSRISDRSWHEAIAEYLSK